MRRRRAIIAGAAAATVAVGITGGAVAFAVGDDDGPPLTGPARDRAVAAALAETGGGRANEVERDSENGATFEVEVTKPDGRTVDVRLDGNYKIVVVEGDSEAPDRGDGDN